MYKLPVIVGLGGINSSGRSSSDHGFLRMVYSDLPKNKKDKVIQSVSSLMDCDFSNHSDAEIERHVLDNTLIRGINDNHFDINNVYQHKKVVSKTINGEGLSFNIPKNKLPSSIPNDWAVTSLAHDDAMVNVTLSQDAHFFLPETRASLYNVAGQLPTGLDISQKYNSRNHPKGVQMAIFAISDALGHLGIDWATLQNKVGGDRISVYAGSALSQLDNMGLGGLLGARLLGQRPSSKQLAFGLSDMPAGFINAYTLGHIGPTGNMVGACATFLFNLKQGIHDIQSGRSRVVIVGGSEAPITPEIMEGFGTMGALVNDAGIREINNGVLDYRTACRPFSKNKGFVLSESAQYVILMDDELALEMGATIHGAVPSVFVHSDGFKKSIPSPGVGNYITVGKSLESVKSMLGEESLMRSIMLSHGTGTPLNKVTESEIFSFFSRKHNIAQWPVLANKAYVGHSVAAAAGDQLAMALGIWNHGILPGIHSIDAISDDVRQEGLDFVMRNRDVDSKEVDVAFINSKGFGGNNATANILSPFVTRSMLQKRHGKKAFNKYLQTSEQAVSKRVEYEADCLSNKTTLKYLFNHNVLEGEDVQLEERMLHLGDQFKVDLTEKNPYLDMTE
jgi:acetoacetyl-[acyl-carrier protein] synthase